MRNLITRALIILIIIATLTAITACEPPVEEGDKTITIILIDSNGIGVAYTETTDALYLGQALDEMLLEEDLTMIVENGAYGRFIKSIGNLTPSATQWISIHSDETDPTLVSEPGEWSPVLVYQEITYKLTMLGIDDMPIYDGRIYIFSIGG